MATIRISGVQMLVGPTKKDNLPRILDHIEKSDCDYILFPEMSLTGYNNKFSASRTAEAWQQIAAACRQHYVTAIIGTGEKVEDRTYIQSRIYAHDGALLGTQEKLIPTLSDREWCTPGEELRDFEHNDLRFGCLICNDLWVSPGCGPYPDRRLSYQLGQRDVRLIFHAANSGTDERYLAYHESNLRLRAWESKLYIVTVNAASSNGPINAPTGVVGPDGSWLTQCPLSGEHVFTLDMELD